MSQGQMGGQLDLDAWGPRRENYLRVHNPSLASRSWVKSPKCHSPKGWGLEGARRGARQGTFLSAAAHVGAETWGTERSSPGSRKPLALRLKTGGLQAASDPLTYLLGLKSVWEKKWSQSLKTKRFYNTVQISGFPWIIRKLYHTDCLFPYDSI